ncbi:class I SAM-dependent methyltransferase [Streptomyces sp. NRRL S-350]|uniref:class I SAM-dependent methyltransferase n=1 Tax=Streptomyces sp. NRRL S-350 TaxID=1463902 RepID=UPI00068B38E6|nr:class I SAM-dependent methyltransferase [Streptomyces sp. NRRL S-350]
MTVTSAAPTVPVGALFSQTHREFESWYSRLWGPLGALAASVSQPREGERVLDACCGSGASAVPAARAVGPTGRVDAVDMADALLEQGRAEADRQGLAHLRFHRGDATTWHADTPYDLVQCCYGVFFFPDMDAGTRHLVDLLRPGGRIAVSTWVGGGMDSMVRRAREAASAVRPLPPLPATPDPRTRVNSADGLAAWLRSFGLVDVEVHRVDYRVPMLGDDAWMFVLGAAPRRFVLGMDEQQLGRVRDRLHADLAAAGHSHLDASSLIAVGVRPE